MSIRIRSFTFITLILVAVIPVTVLSLTLYGQIHGLVNQMVHSQLESSTDTIEAELSYKLAILTNGLGLLSSKENIRNSIDDLIYSVHLPAELAHFVTKTPLVESVYLLGADGYVIESYKGNILALERSKVLDLAYLNDNRVTDFAKMSKVTLLANEALLEEKNHKEALAFIVPIYSDKALDNIQVQGHLIAIVPIYKLLRAANDLLDQQESIAIAHNDDLLEDISGQNNRIQFNAMKRLVVSGDNYQNAVWLTISVGQRSERLDEQAQATLAPGMASSAIVLISIVCLVMLFAHLISRAFGQLYALIHDVEHPDTNGKRRKTNFFIKEFSDLAMLLSGMRSTISSQLSEVNNKNRELARVDKLRAAYLEEVQELNNHLESKVEHRTHELERSLERLAQSSFFFEQLTQLRRVLEASVGNRQVVHESTRILSSCFPEVDIAIYIPRIHSHREVFSTVNIDMDNKEGLNKLVQSQAYPNWERFSVEFKGKMVNVFGIRCGQDKLGWLLLNESHVSEESSNRLSLFTTELSSFLENRALNEELDFLARTDSLTGIKNRKAFDELQFELETQLDSKVGLFVIDVNGLKQMNDEKGHEKGDLLICSVADVLRRCCADYTPNFFRIGGDEFAIMLQDELLDSAPALLESLLSYQKRHLDIELDSFGGEPVVSFSVGYASTEEEEFSRLYKVADHNMYLNKQQFYSSLRQLDV